MADRAAVRAAKPRDAAATAAIYAHHVAHGTASFDTEPRSEAEMAAKIAECTARGWPFLVAEIDGQVVGYAYATQFRDRPAYTSTCENSIYLHPDHLGRGIGTLLLDALVEAAEHAGFRQMIAVVGGAEPASVALHSKAGFVEAGRMRSVGRKFGRWLDTLYMQKTHWVRRRDPAGGRAMSEPLPRRLAAEGIGSFFLFATVIGSGVMAEALAGGNVAIALLGNTLATGAILFVLITMLGPVSGGHFNPAVSLVMAGRGELSWRDALPYIVAQLIGGLLGAWAAHLMFDLPILQYSLKARTGIGQWSGELVATFGLILTILGTLKHRPAAVPASVGLYITAAYWFTSSTSFANPAITIIRSLSDSFAGIAPRDVPLFIAAQLVGALLAALVAPLLFGRREPGTA